MMNIVKEKKTFIAIVVLLTFLFYWFQIRPARIRSACDQIAWDKAKSSYYEDKIGDPDEYNWKYTQCLHNKGIKY